MNSFFFGAATSSHQVEGDNHNDWSVWERKNAERLAKEARAPFDVAKEKDNYISGKACEHYNRFREDFDIAKLLGHNAHRFSIEWSRIEPKEGKFDQKEIEHYRDVIRALQERFLEPFVTVWHWTLPVWLAEKGGLLAPDFAEYFARYAEKLAQEFKGDVKFWITVNEPEVISWNGYGRGVWPPNKKGTLSARRAMLALASAHKAVYRRIKATDAAAQVGATMHMDWFESTGGFVNDIRALFADKIRNFYFLDKIRRETDFIGFNYYFHNRIDGGFNKNKNEIVSDMGWEIYPEGMYRVLMKLKKYEMPIYITENGLADAQDSRREAFITEHLTWMRKAMDEGVDVRGYFHWSLLDNFEWDKGFWPRFGLVEVDYRTLTRKIRLSARAYEKIIKKWHEQ
jgi:beta-glucosidase